LGIEGIELPLVRYEVKTSINRVEHLLHSYGYGSHVQDGRGFVWRASVLVNFAKTRHQLHADLMVFYFSRFYALNCFQSVGIGLVKMSCFHNISVTHTHVGVTGSLQKLLFNIQTFLPAVRNLLSYKGRVRHIIDNRSTTRLLLLICLNSS
jgi:hypothetical protein